VPKARRQDDLDAAAGTRSQAQAPNVYDAAGTRDPSDGDEQQQQRATGNDDTSGCSSLRGRKLAGARVERVCRSSS
jgi:hypothetical protein